MPQRLGPSALSASSAPERREAPTRLLGLATALAPYEASQEQLERFMTRALAGDDRTRAWLERVFAGSGIERRRSVLSDYAKDDPADFTFFPRDWSLEPFPSTAARMKVFERWSVALCARAAQDALARAGLPARAVTHLILATCTGFFAPGPDALLIDRLGLRRDVRRTVIGFMGCYAGFSGLRLADQIARAEPGAVVLQVCVELCSLHFQKRPEPSLQVGNVLFGDGAAAAVFAARSEGGAGLAGIAATHSRVAEDSLGQMSWRIGDTGFEMQLDARIPKALGAHAGAFAAELLSRAGLARPQIAGWAVHPGGRRIVEEVRAALGLEPDDVRSALEVLRDHGNMSSATIFFVLERELARRSGPVVALGFGPGLTMEGAVLEATPK